MSDGIVDTYPDVGSPLADIRWALAEALAESPWPVHVSAVDAVDGPCLIILSGAREPMAIGCNYATRPVVICVAGRVEPGAGSDVLDAQECFVLARLPWPLDRVEDEALMTFGGVNYLGRRIVSRTSVNIPRAQSGS